MVDEKNDLKIADLVKLKLGITSNVRDQYLNIIIESVLDELKDTHRLNLDLNNLFCVAYF